MVLISASKCLLAAVLCLGVLSVSLPGSTANLQPAHSFRVQGLELRDVAAGGFCGAAAGRDVCGAGLCCSAAGLCGTGAPFCSAPDCQLSFGPACDGNQIPVGQDTSSLPRPAIGRVPYGVDVSHCNVPGKVALTFDDGPYIYTTELLDILKKNNAKATFFVVGNNGGKGQIELGSSGYPAILQRMYAEGHQIGSHSWSHQDMGKISSQQRREQILRNEVALVDVLGFFPTYFRPPYTSCPAECYADLGNLGYHVVNYDIDTKDWAGDYAHAQNTYTSALSQRSPGSSSWITLAHDIQPNTVHSLAQYMIDQARKLGYELVTVGECLGDPVENWYRNPANGQAWGAKVVASVAAPPPTPSPVAISPIPNPTPESIIPTNTLKPSSPKTTSLKPEMENTIPTTFLILSSVLSEARASSTAELESSSGLNDRPVFESMKTSAAAEGSVFATAPTPTPVDGGSFRAGSGAQNTTSSVVSGSLSASETATSMPATGEAVDFNPSLLGLFVGVLGFVYVF